jgi:hypothetical protein
MVISGSTSGWTLRPSKGREPGLDRKNVGNRKRRGLVPHAVDLTPLRAATPDEFGRALEASQAEAGLCLVAARVDPSWYRVLA